LWPFPLSPFAFWVCGCLNFAAPPTSSFSRLQPPLQLHSSVCNGDCVRLPHPVSSSPVLCSDVQTSSLLRSDLNRLSVLIASILRFNFFCPFISLCKALEAGLQSNPRWSVDGWMVAGTMCAVKFSSAFFLAASVCQFHIQFNCSSCAWVSCLFRVCKCYRSFSVLCARWLFLNPACHNKPAAAAWVFHACATAGVQQSPITLTAKQPYITEEPQTAKRELVVSCDRLVFLRVCGIVNSHNSMTTNACTYRS
jgi:hypothetical protein